MYGGKARGWTWAPGRAESVRTQPSVSPPFACSIGENLQLLVDRPDGTYCFRLHNDRVYYVR